MKYLRLFKGFFDNDNTLDYGMLTEEDIKAQTKGFKFDGTGCYVRKGCNYFYFTLDK